MEADFDPTCENILLPSLVACSNDGHQAVTGLGLSEQISVTPSVWAIFRKAAIPVLPLDGTHVPLSLLQLCCLGAQPVALSNVCPTWFPTLCPSRAGRPLMVNKILEGKHIFILFIINSFMYTSSHLKRFEATQPGILNHTCLRQMTRIPLTQSFCLRGSVTPIPTGSLQTVRPWTMGL